MMMKFLFLLIVPLWGCTTAPLCSTDSIKKTTIHQPFNDCNISINSASLFKIDDGLHKIFIDYRVSGIVPEDCTLYCEMSGTEDFRHIWVNCKSQIPLSNQVGHGFFIEKRIPAGRKFYVHLSLVRPSHGMAVFFERVTRSNIISIYYKDESSKEGISVNHQK